MEQAMAYEEGFNTSREWIEATEDFDRNETLRVSNERRHAEESREMCPRCECRLCPGCNRDHDCLKAAKEYYGVE